MAYWTQPLEQWRREHRRAEYGCPEPKGLASRPWAWWYFESPEPRRKLGGKGEPFGESRDYFGMPHGHLGYEADDPPLYESERDYLRRLSLLDLDAA